MRRLICHRGGIILEHCRQAADDGQGAGDREVYLFRIQYIRERKNILGAISLDLFVVLLGGATPCCRPMRATFCTPGRGDWDCYVWRLRWARSGPRYFWRITQFAAGPAIACSLPC